MCGEKQIKNTLYGQKTTFFFTVKTHEACIIITMLKSSQKEKPHIKFTITFGIIV